MADNLPRPATGGRWWADDEYVLTTRTTGVETIAMMDDGSENAPEDAEAIAALPERIRRMDGARLLCEWFLGAGPSLTSAYVQGYAAACRDVLRWLDGEASDA